MNPFKLCSVCYSINSELWFHNSLLHHHSTIFTEMCVPFLCIFSSFSEEVNIEPWKSNLNYSEQIVKFYKPNQKILLSLTYEWVSKYCMHRIKTILIFFSGKSILWLQKTALWCLLLSAIFFYLESTNGYELNKIIYIYYTV